MGHYSYPHPEFCVARVHDPISDYLAVRLKHLHKSSTCFEYFNVFMPCEQFQFQINLVNKTRYAGWPNNLLFPPLKFQRMVFIWSDHRFWHFFAIFFLRVLAIFCSIFLYGGKIMFDDFLQFS